MAVVRGDNSLFFATGLDNSGLKRGALDAVGLIQGLANNISRINPFAALALGAVAAFTAIASEAYKMSKNFEHAMKEVETISDATKRNFDGISRAVFELSKITPDGPEKLAKAYYQIVSAGYDGAKGLKLLETASKSAVAGVTDTLTAADGITTVLNAFKLEAEQAEEVSDALFKTVQLGKTTFSELSQNLAQAAPLAAATGVNFKELLAAVATLTKQGVPTAQAMTQIRAAIEATSEVMGDGWTNAYTLQEAFQAVYDQAGGSQNKLKELTGRVEAVSAILSTAGRNAKGAADDLDALGNATGATEDAFQRMSSSNVNQIEILRNRIRATTKDIGDTVLDMSNAVAGGLNDLLDANDSVVKGLVDHRRKISDLSFEYNSSNTSLERKQEILKELKALNPSIVAGLGKEGDEYVLLTGKLNEYNELLKVRIGLEKELNQESDLLKEKSSIERTLTSLQDKQTRIVLELNNELLSGNLKLSEGDEKKFKEILKTDYDNQFKKVSALKEVLAGSDNLENISAFNKAERNIFGSTRNIANQSTQFSRFSDRLKELNKDLDTTQGTINKTILSSLNINPEPVLDALDAFKDIKKVSEQLGVDIRLVDDDEVKRQIKIIDEATGVISKISGITKDQYTANKDILKEYLASENAEIRKAAEEREKALKFKPTGGATTDDRTEGERFEDQLNERKKQYDSYENYIEQQGQAAADKQFQKLLEQGASYAEYLQNQLKLYQDYEDKKVAISDAASKADVSLQPRELAETISQIKPQPIVVDIAFDTTSINAIEREIARLENQRKAALTQTERDLVQIKIDAAKQRLAIANGNVEDEIDLYANLTRAIGELSNKELRLRIADKKAELAEKLKDERKYANEIAALRGQIQQGEEQIGQNTADTIGQITGVLSEASSLFKKFGDEDTAQLLDQLAGVASGVGEIAKGFASGNPLDIIKGGLAVLNSAITVEVVSDTAKFEAAIKDLEKAIEKLDYVISKSIGQDRITSRTQAIDDLKELEKQADLAKQAELDARKEVKLLGITIAKKGAGSGKDPAKLGEIEQKAEDARQKAQELREQLDELYTATTRGTIVDSIISGLKEGKKNVADFADTFKELMQDALLQAFELKYLEKEVDKFYEAFANAGSDSNYTAEEINALRNLYNQMIMGAQDDLDAINDILNQTGIGNIGDNAEKSGLSGAISTITEDTANILAGTLNSIRIDISNGLAVAQQNTTYLSMIAQNTSYNRHLEDMSLRLKNIETALT